MGARRFQEKTFTSEMQALKECILRIFKGCGLGAHLWSNFGLHYI